MTTIYVRNARIYTTRKKKKNQKLVDKTNLHGYSFTHNWRTIEGRCKIQNDLRAIMFSIVDISSQQMENEEREVWKKALWGFSDLCTNFYKIKHNLGVWNH